MIHDLIRSAPDEIAEPLESKLFDRLQEQPERVSRVIMPALAPAIRQTVQRSMVNMFDASSRAIDQGLSLNSWKWRLRAWRSGKRYSEIAMMESLLFEVDDVLLIDRNSGLLIAQASRSSGVKNAKVTSGMLTAIRDFVKDSFEDGDDHAELSQFRVGGRTILVEPGNKAILALAVRGAPTYDLRMKATKCLFGIHRDHLNDPALSPAARNTIEAKLEPLLLSEQKKMRSYGRPVLFLLAALIPLLLALAALRGKQRKATLGTLSELRANPGFILGSVEHKEGTFHVHGSHDPVLFEPAAALDALDLEQEQVTWHLKRHLSLEDAALEKRATLALTPPDGITLRCEDGVLHVAGSADAEWLGACRAFASVIPGIQGVEVSATSAVSTPSAMPQVTPAEVRVDAWLTQVEPRATRVEPVAAQPAAAPVEVVAPTVFEAAVEHVLVHEPAPIKTSVVVEDPPSTFIPAGNWSTWE